MNTELAVIFCVHCLTETHDNALVSFDVASALGAIKSLIRSLTVDPLSYFSF